MANFCCDLVVDEWEMEEAFLVVVLRSTRSVSGLGYSFDLRLVVVILAESTFEIFCVAFHVFCVGASGESSLEVVPGDVYFCFHWDS